MQVARSMLKRFEAAGGVLWSYPESLVLAPAAGASMSDYLPAVPKPFALQNDFEVRVEPAPVFATKLIA